MKSINDYGILVTVQVEKDMYLFLDGIDRDRYISSLIKNIDSEFKNMPYPLIAGLSSNCAMIVFDGSSEEILRYIIRKVHISYSAYRRNKRCPVRFKPSKFRLIDGVSELYETVKKVKEKSEFICTKFECQKVNRNI